MNEISPSLSCRRRSSECLMGTFGTCPHSPAVCARSPLRSVHASIEIGRPGRTVNSQIALAEGPGQGSSPSVKLRRDTGNYPFLASVLDKATKQGLTSNRVIHICLWTLVLQSHEYQARLVLPAGRERTVFARGKPVLGSCARDTMHSKDRAFLPTEFRHQFENKLPRDRVFRNVRRDGTVRRIRNRSHPIRNLEGAISGFSSVAEDMTGRTLGVRFPREALSTADRWPTGRCLGVLLDPNGRVATSRVSVTRIIGFHAEEKSDLGGSSTGRTTAPL
jgi:hypothetical protein